MVALFTGGRFIYHWYINKNNMYSCKALSAAVLTSCLLSSRVTSFSIETTLDLGQPMVDIHFIGIALDLGNQLTVSLIVGVPPLDFILNIVVNFID